MADERNPVVDFGSLELKRRDMAPGIGSDSTNVTRAAGLTHLGASYFEVKPGEAAFPFHVHYQEDEIIFILSGTGTYRYGDRSYEVGPGDFICAPAGRTEQAHQLTNTGADTLKYFCVSNLPENNVVELPELGVLRVHNRRKDGPESVELELPKAD